MKKTTIALLLTLGLGTATLFAYGGPDGAQGEHCKYHKGGNFKHHKGERMMQMIRQLDLSDAQKAQLKQMKEASKAERKSLREQRKAHRQAMQESMRPDMGQFISADKFDKEAFKTQMNQRFEARRSMMEQKRATMLERRADKMEKIFNILTPEQRIKWIELSKQKGQSSAK